MRLFHLADTVEVFHRAGGVDAAVEVARARRGKHFDPEVADVFCRAAPDVLADMDAMAEFGALIDKEPGLSRRLSDGELDSALEVMADFTDLRSSSRAGHSRGVAHLAATAAGLCGLPDKEIVTLRRAALVHDIGMHGVPASILDKAGPLSGAEWERMRLHSYWTERVLARPAALARIGAIASLANERLDGSGYHRGLSGSAIPAAGRILAAADACRAMTEPRAHRPALSLKQTSAGLRREVRSGRLAADAVDAVLAAAGQPQAKRRAGPSGLTPREIEVLTLIARGASTRQVARALGITARTAGTHIERIYAKIGASTRPTATLFAMQQGRRTSAGRRPRPDRCNNKNQPGYKRYGGRGLVMCVHLALFSGFMYEVGPRPAPELTLDRVNNDLGYLCQACNGGIPQLRWATREQQARNRSTSTGLVYAEPAGSIMARRAEAARYPGVVYKPRRSGKGAGKFEAYRGKYLGRADSAAEAARLRDEAMAA